MGSRGHRIVAIVCAVVLSCGAAGCGLFSGDPGPDEVVADFLGALASGDTARAADLTDTPTSAKRVLDQARSALRPDSVDVAVRSVRGDSATATTTFGLGWHLPKGRFWQYDGEAQLFSGDSGWKVRWSPSVLHPKLAAEQTIRLSEEPAELAPVLDRDNEVLFEPGPSGLRLADPALSGKILPEWRPGIEPMVTGRAGWRVVALDSSGGEVNELHAEEAQPAPAAKSTISARVQRLANQALADVRVPGVLVALEPSTGEVLALSQNSPADDQGGIALTGRYAPGSTFKIATAAAALTEGRVTADTPVDCPSSAFFEGREVPNDDRFSLGTVPLSTAFARSCNTTFARLATELPPNALPDAARSLGIGADFVLPGLTTVTGSVPQAESVVQKAENGFGQGTVLVSPFGMALAAATVATGSLRVPTVLRGVPTQAQHLGAPIKPEVLDALRRMTREVVTSGTAGALAELPEAHGKTGTAQFGDGTHAHGWFAGYSGDLAFAVLLVDGGTSAPAVDVAHRFLTSLR